MGVPRIDDESKVRMLQAEAERGVARAQRILAGRYLRGKGVPKDPSLGACWMRKAAEQGLAVAQRSLGELIEAGIGVEQDREQARHWYRLAAEQGDPIARARLSRP